MYSKNLKKLKIKQCIKQKMKKGQVMKLEKKKIKEWLINNAKWIALFLGIVGFLALAEDVWNKELME